MITSVDPLPAPDRGPAARSLPSVVAALALLSVAAGFIHAAVIDSHRGHGLAEEVFTAIAVFQVAWAGLVLVRPTRWVLAAGAVANVAILGGWALNRTSGIPFLDGFEEAEGVALTDAVVAGLEVLLVLGALALLAPVARRPWLTERFANVNLGVVGAAIALLAVPAVAEAGAFHDHGQAELAAHGADGHHEDGAAAHVESAEDVAHGDDEAHDEEGVHGDVAHADEHGDEHEGRSGLELASAGHGSSDDHAGADDHGSSDHHGNATGHAGTASGRTALGRTVVGRTGSAAGHGGHTGSGGSFGSALGDLAGAHGTGGAQGGAGPGHAGGHGGTPAGPTGAPAHPPAGQHGAHGTSPVEHGGAHVDQPAGHPGTHAGPPAAHPGPPDGHAGHGSGSEPSASGASPEQQAAADRLLADTKATLPQWSDEAAHAAGFRTIGDGFTGTEHLLNWEWITDDVVLDPNRPESLVYNVAPDGTRELAAAMFILPPGADIPDVGGTLTQWHIHNNLCFTPETDVDGHPARRVIGLTTEEGTCNNGERLPDAAMLHVWIVDHPCGPFSSLEGVGAGQAVDEAQDPNANPACQHSTH